MVKNREELIKVASSNANQLKGHLRKAVSGFLKSQKVTAEELAYVLGITMDEMMQILEGDGNITVNALSKLLVATDMAVEIKPVRNTPLGAYGAGMPHSGGFPGPGGIPVDENGRPLPPIPGFNPEFMGGMPPMPGAFRRREERATDGMEEVPMETTGPKRDAHGRFVKKTAGNGGTRAHNAAAPHAPRPRTAEAHNPYANISDAELVNIIRQNIWDGEIDTDNATHDELAAFVANKERIMRERAEGREQAPKAEEPKVNGGGEALNQFLEMLGNMAKEAEKNPDLVNAFKQFMPKH